MMWMGNGTEQSLAMSLQILKSRFVAVSFLHWTQESRRRLSGEIVSKSCDVVIFVLIDEEFLVLMFRVFFFCEL